MNFNGIRINKFSCKQITGGDSERSLISAVRITPRIESVQRSPALVSVLILSFYSERTDADIGTTDLAVRLSIINQVFWSGRVYRSHGRQLNI